MIAAIDDALQDLRSDPHIRSVRWDTNYGRFRMYLEGSQRAIYVPVKQYHALTKGAHLDMDRFSIALADAVAGVQERARPAVAAEAVPLEDHGEAA